jgi:hypothetical protein
MTAVFEPKTRVPSCCIFHIHGVRCGKWRAQLENSPEKWHVDNLKRAAWTTYQFIKRLNKVEQMAFVRGSLKFAHLDAAKALYQPRTALENELVERERALALLPATVAAEPEAKKQDGDNARYVGRKALQKAIVSAFNKKFEGRLVSQVSIVAGDPSTEFCMRSNGWNINTHFWFGRKENLISYVHSISSDEMIQHPRNPQVHGPAKVLAHMLCWIWLCSMEWKYLTTKDVEPACDSILELCGQFFNVLPSLLDGLEYEKIAD